ncbi:MAG: methyltransferase domain-containing protein [Myxococcota bacterium]
MNSVGEHYNRLLGPIFKWSVSVGGDPFERAMRLLRQLDLLDAESYLDLGAGFGVHAIPLAEAGKNVTVVDTNAALMGELRAVAEARKLSIAQSTDDLLCFLDTTVERRWDVILCLGDTITHLSSVEEVQRMLTAAAQHLNPGGRLVLGYRDSTKSDLEGLARFIPVARDAHRSMHCLLEALDDRRLRVTDILTEVRADGPSTRMSDYVKLRIGAAEVSAWGEQSGLQTAATTLEQGSTHIILRLAAKTP